MPTLDAIKIEVISRLVGNRSEQAERWRRDEIDEAFDAIVAEAVEAAFGGAPAVVVSQRILQRRIELAQRIHAEVAGASEPVTIAEPVAVADVVELRRASR